MTQPPQSRCGVLLAGGVSARFGGAPKGLMPFGDARVADFPLRALQAVCREVVISANDPRAADWFPGHRIVGDTLPGRGALSALETALLAGDGHTVVVCAWDMPFVSAALLESLVAVVEGGAACCVPQHVDRQLEPLCAAYATRCTPTATRLLAEGERAAHRLVEACGGAYLPIPAVADAADLPHPCFNVNTAAVLERASVWFTLHRSDT